MLMKLNLMTPITKRPGLPNVCRTIWNSYWPELMVILSLLFYLLYIIYSYINFIHSSNWFSYTYNCPVKKSQGHCGQQHNGKTLAKNTLDCFFRVCWATDRKPFDSVQSESFKKLETLEMNEENQFDFDIKKVNNTLQYGSEIQLRYSTSYSFKSI